MSLDTPSFRNRPLGTENVALLDFQDRRNNSINTKVAGDRASLAVFSIHQSGTFTNGSALLRFAGAAASSSRSLRTRHGSSSILGVPCFLPLSFLPPVLVQQLLRPFPHLIAARIAVSVRIPDDLRIRAEIGDDGVVGGIEHDASGPSHDFLQERGIGIDPLFGRLEQKSIMDCSTK